MVTTKELAKMYLTTYGQMIQFYREEHKISRSELAAACGCSESVIRYIESGLMLPPEFLEDKIFDFLDI